MTSFNYKIYLVKAKDYGGKIMTVSILNDQTTNEEFLDFVIQEIHNAVVSTTNGDLPSAQVVDLLMHRGNKVYIVTSQNNHPFFDNLNAAEATKSNVLINGYKGEGTMDSCGFSIQTQIKNIKHEYIEEIFVKNPYLNTIYQDNLEEAKNDLNVFELTPIKAGYLDHRTTPIYGREFIF